MYTQEIIASALKSYTRKEIRTGEYTGFARASVLIPVFPANKELSILLTVRTDEVETHKGEIAFPGGMQDRIDRDTIHTALRETEEEIGVHGNFFTILGLLDDHPVPSRYIITPVVGYSDIKPVTKLNPSEVAEVFDVPLSFFADEKNGTTEKRNFNGREFTVWYFTYGKHLIWGATAAIIRNLITIISSQGR